MLKQAVSHFLAIIVCLIAGSFLLDLVRANLAPENNYIDKVAGYLVEVFKLQPYGLDNIAIVIYAVLLAFFWGAFSGLITHRSH